jgi:predicted secreted protein
MKAPLPTDSPVNSRLDSPAASRLGMPSRFSGARALMVALACLCAAPGHAQDHAPVNPQPVDVLNLDASVSSEIAPDLAVVVLAVTREGVDAAAMTRDVNQVLARAIAQAKAIPEVQVASGAFSTTPRYDNKGQRNGWQVRAELILKSKDSAALGKLVGRLSTEMDIASNGFELSPELRAAEEAKMIDRVVAAFQAKASAAAKAFGYLGYSIRSVTLGQASRIGDPGQPRPMMQAKAMAMAAPSEPMPIESGRMNLQLSLHGSVQMRK